MKKIFLLFILFLTINCFAFDLNVIEEQKARKVSNKSLDSIETYLGNVNLNDDEYIVIAAKKSEYGKLYDIKIDWQNMEDDKADLIVEKLKSMPSVPSINSNEITIIITKKPDYEKNKNLAVACFASDSKTNSTKKEMQGYLMYLRTKLYMEWKQSNTQKPVLIYTEIDKNGNVTAYSVLKSAGEEIDKKMKAALKQTVTSVKPFEFNSDTLPMMFSFGSTDKTLQDVVKNINIQDDKDFYAVAKIELNKKGILSSADIETSSGDEAIDNELIKAIKITNDFSEIINFDENSKIIYLQFTGIKGRRYFVTHSEENTKQINWIPYLKEVELQSKKNWTAPNSQEVYIVRAILFLNKDGKITDKKIIISSGNKNADNAVLKSVEEGIYPKFPEGFKGKVMPVETTFMHYAKNPSSSRMEKWKSNPWLHLYY